MRNRQGGMTTLGLLILLAFIGMVGFGIIQLVPVYLENMKVQQVMNQTKGKLDGQNATIADIRKQLGDMVNIEDLRQVDYRKDFVITRTQDGHKVSMDYTRERSFVANVYLMTKFSHAVEIVR